MALQLPTELETSVTVTYWRIIELRGLYREQQTRVILGGYLSQAARMRSETPVVTRDHMLDGNLADTGARADAYARVKALNEWTGASDV